MTCHVQNYVKYWILILQHRWNFNEIFIITLKSVSNFKYISKRYNLTRLLYQFRILFKKREHVLWHRYTRYKKKNSGRKFHSNQTCNIININIEWKLYVIIYPIMPIYIAILSALIYPVLDIVWDIYIYNELIITR